MYVMYLDHSDLFLPTPRATLTEFDLCCPYIQECEALYSLYPPTRGHLHKENLTVLREAIFCQEALHCSAA